MPLKKNPSFFDLILKSGLCLIEDSQGQIQSLKRDIGIQNGVIKEIGLIPIRKGLHVFSAEGLHILPGVIDTQVHFREPGWTHKEDLYSGSKGAVLGGVTSICEMPNTSPPTVDVVSLEDKVNRAKKKCWCDYAFFMGATRENAHQLYQLEKLPSCVGIKIFMGSSTGPLLLYDPEVLDLIFRSTQKRIAIHCEDERRLQERRKSLFQTSSHLGVHLHPEWRDSETALRATRRVFSLSEKYQHPVHVLHVTTKEEIDFFSKHKKAWMSAECTPQHLTLSSPECYERFGTYAQMNPPIRSEEHREALWRGIRTRLIDVIGSDHAPHTREEKERDYPKSPSGMTGVQTSLPLMLDHVSKGHLSLERLVELMSSNPSKMYRIKGKGAIQRGYDADLTLVDMKKRKKITSSWMASRSGWTVFDNWTVQGWPKATIIRGNWVMKEDEVLNQPLGESLHFF